MREIESVLITEVVEKLFIKANYTIPKDIEDALKSAYIKEKTDICRSALDSIIKNIDAAKELDIPVCQDTGMAVVFIEIGQDVHIVGESLKNAINKGVRNAYLNGYLRCSIVSDPLKRINTNDNTPAIIHTEIVDGEKIKITAAPKGFGSENMSSLKMLTPSANLEDIIDFIVNSVIKAGSNPCPPVIVGVGIGGNFEQVALLSKKALLRPLNIKNSDPFYADLEKKSLNLINKTGIGAQGFGGTQTALSVNIETFPTHIAGLPIAVNMSCHATRHESEII